MLGWSIIASPSLGPGSSRVRQSYPPLTGINEMHATAAAHPYPPSLHPRPDGSGAVSPEGIAYYNRLIDALLAKGVTPVVTLSHWDLPLSLHRRHGGWLNETLV